MISPVSSSFVFENNVATIKEFSPEHYEVILQGTHRKVGFEEISSKSKKNTAGNDSKLRESVCRTRSVVRELALCNSWELFGTFTLSSVKYDRTDLEKFKKDFTKWLQNMNTRYGCSIRYLLIPEQHKNGAWHMHGLFSGIPKEFLVPFTLEDGVPYDLTEKGYLNFPKYQDKFGFCSFGRIRSQEGAANYITKYISKDLTSSEVGLNKHLYFASRGLKRAKVITRGFIYTPFSPDYSNEYIAKKTYSSLDDALVLFEDDGLCYPVALEDISPEAMNRRIAYEASVNNGMRILSRG